VFKISAGSINTF